MELYEAVGVALAATALVSVAVIEYLLRALRGVLAACHVDAPLARFWAAFAHVLVLLLPASAELFALAFMTPPKTPDWLWVLGLVKWGFLGLVATVAVIGVGVTTFAQGRSVPLWVPPEQADDLQRMLDRVRVLRAREVVRKSDDRDDPLPARARRPRDPRGLR